MEAHPQQKKKSHRKSKTRIRPPDSEISADGAIPSVPELHEFESKAFAEADSPNEIPEGESMVESPVISIQDSSDSASPLVQAVTIQSDEFNSSQLKNGKVNFEPENPIEAEPEQELDPCEEALSILATAPLNFESGDFYSIPSLAKPEELGLVEEESDVLKADAKPSHQSNIKSFYNNYLLENNSSCITQFLDSLQPACDGFELFELLSNYLRAYNHLTGCQKGLLMLKENCDESEKKVWKLSVKHLSETAQCEDGNTLTATYKAHQAEFVPSHFSQLTRTLKEIKELVKDSFSLYTYSVQLSRTQIEHFLYKSFGHFNLEDFYVRSYSSAYSSNELRGFAALLKRTITVFFHFLRKPLLHASFGKDCQDWISRCCGLLLRIATIEDHIFLLNHVIRLPPRVVAGFGAPLVQVPPIPIPTNPSDYSASFTHLHLDYALTFLATILSPVPKRAELLSQYEIALRTAPAIPDASLQWVFVDSDGEDDTADESLFFKEVDLIALLQQVPFDKIFRRVMLIYTDEGEDVIDIKMCSEHSVLKLIAFASQLIAIFGNGLVTYHTDRYRQLVKLIGRLTLHTIQYVSDQVEVFLEAGGRNFVSSPVFSEYDVFLYEAVSVLITGKNVGMVQFLSAVRYHLVSTAMLWEIYALITKWNLSGSEDISNEFEHELVAMTESNSFYTLTTMSNMALARRGTENQFVKLVTFHLFQIGFLSPVTRDVCSKTVRDLLGNLSYYPRVISNLLSYIKQNMGVIDKLALFLVRELAFYAWKPTIEDLQTVSHWMLNFHTFSLENQVGRIILQSMNWDYDEEGELFLHQAVHTRVALLVVESHYKWERPQNVISESVKQISAWVTRNPDFTSWAWDTIKRLHLHGFDRHRTNPPRMSSIISKLPSFESHSELSALQKAITEKSPVACAVGLLLTPCGHSLPIVCTQGFELLDVLLQNSKFEATINCLFFLVPLFAGSRESIITCEKFRNILTALLAADMTYVRMAKSLVTTEFPGAFTKIFGEMIDTQLVQYGRFATTKKRLILLWLNLLTKIPNWNKDNNILYLLDVIARFSLREEESKGSFYNYFNTMYKEMPKSSSYGIASYLFNWSYSAATVLPQTSYTFVSYFAFIIFTIESNQEIESGFWKSLSVSLGNPKVPLENAVKKACGSTKYSTTSSYLTIYRWAQHCLELPFSHPLLLVFWQKFFLKYFHRSAGDSGGGIGERFFEGMINTSFLKKLKKRLHDTLQFYSEEISKLENESGSIDENLGENTSFILDHLKKCFALVNGMTLWIEDPRYHQDSLYIPALPPQCLPILLHTLMEGDFTDWTEYIDYDAINTIEKSASQSYLILINRLCWTQTRPYSMPSSLSSTLVSRREELLKRLSSYDIPLEPPPVPSFPQILPNISKTMFTDLEAMESGLRKHFTRLVEFAQQFSLHISKHTALDCSYADNLPDLYSITESEALVNVECTSGKVSGCSGPGHVIFKYCEARLNERVGHIIHQNRTEYHNLMSQYLTLPPPFPISVAAVFIEDYITNLILFHRNMIPESEERSKVERIGIELFYLIVNYVKEDTNFYPPTRQLFSSFLEVLGQDFVENDSEQCHRLVSMCIKRPELVGSLAPHMKLVATNTETLVRIYEAVINIPERNGDLAFVILSKLDLRGWLRKRKPRLLERSKLISLMWKGVVGDLPNSEKRNAMVHGTYRNHLKTMLQYDFPQHYGEILNLLLEDSEKNMVPLELWYDFFNALSWDSVRFSQEMDPFLLKRELKRFSMEVDILRHQEIVETALLLATHFKKERLTYSIYGLYPKYRVYVEPLSCFLQLISYSLISSSLKNSRGSPSQHIVEAVWPLLRDLYTPWILPYNQRVVQQDCAQWIQQMNFDSASVLQPWIASDANYAALFMNDFTDSVLFLAETLPGCSILFSYLWKFYAENYAHATVKEHVVNLVNNCFISISWGMFWPSMSDLELMNKVVEKYLPVCHSLLGVIFAQINWTDWILQFSGSTGSVKNKCSAVLLNLTVHLATDIVARESPTWTGVMHTIQNLNWEFILASSLEPVLNWYVMSIDPRVVLAMDVIHHLDKASFQLLRIASGYGIPEELRRIPAAVVKIDLNRKRYLFVRSYIRLLLSASTKYKHLLQTNKQSFEKSLQNILDDILAAARAEEQERSEYGSHLKEVIGLISNHYLGTVLRDAAIGWLESNKHAPLGLIYEILQIIFSSKVLPYITVPLIETAIPLVFLHDDGNWNGIVELVSLADKSEQTQCLDVASKDGHFLLLYCLLLNKSDWYIRGSLQSVSSLTEIMKNMKPKEANEAVLPLLYGFFLNVCVALLQEAKKHIGGQLEKAVKKFLNGLYLHLTSVGDDKQGWVLLGALGLTKASLLTVRGRLFARCLSVFVLAQLPVNSPVRLDTHSPIGLDLNSPLRLDVKRDEILPVKTTTDPKPHPDLENSLLKLGELKLNPKYAELIDCIEFAITFITDATNTLSSHEKFIRLLTAHLFTESYLFSKSGTTDEDLIAEAISTEH